MDQFPPCPDCASEYTYNDGTLFVCPDCGREFLESDVMAAEEGETTAAVIKDAVGNILQDGDTVTVIKDKKVSGSSKILKIGTKAKNIRLIPGGGDHNIDCKIPGFGAMRLKSSVVKKS